MSKQFLVAESIVMIIFTTVFTANGQVPKLFNYQAILTDPVTNDPLSGD